MDGNRKWKVSGRPGLDRRLARRAVNAHHRRRQPLSAFRAGPAGLLRRPQRQAPLGEGRQGVRRHAQPVGICRIGADRGKHRRSSSPAARTASSRSTSSRADRSGQAKGLSAGPDYGSCLAITFQNMPMIVAGHARRHLRRQRPTPAPCSGATSLRPATRPTAPRPPTATDTSFGPTATARAESA